MTLAIPRNGPADRVSSPPTPGRDAFDRFARAPAINLSPRGRTRVRLATDRVRARPAVSPNLSQTIGLTAVGLGIWGLMFPKSMARTFGLKASPAAIQTAFGAREMLSGLTLASDPTQSGMLWGRVAGDALDIAVLSAADRPDNPKRGAARAGLAIVLAVTVLDLVVATRMTNVKRNCI